MFDGVLLPGLGAPQGIRVPSGSPSRNYAHPADRYLSSAIVFDNNKARDIVGPLGTSSLLFGATSIGLGRPGRHLNMVDAGARMARTISGNVTVVAVCRRNTTPTSGVNAISPLMTSFQVVPGIYNGIEFSLGTSYGDVNKVYINKWTAHSSSPATGAWIDGQKQTGANPCDITITNGQWYGIAATITSLVASDPLTFGAYVDGYFKAPNTDIAFCLIYNRVLPDSVAASLSRNPAQALIWPEDRLFHAFKAPAGGTVWNETLSETLTAAENFAGTLTAPVTLAEALTGADAATVALTGAAALAEALTGADSHTATLAAVAAITESATAGEVLSPAMTAGIALSDAGTLADSLSPAATFGLSLADDLTAADALTISAVMAAGLAESVAGAESFATVLLASTSLTDAATLADAYALAIPGTPAPASRTVTWRAHDRLATWAAEPRTVTWRAHDRTAKWQE